jgi:hypothetical protein
VAYPSRTNDQRHTAVIERQRDDLERLQRSHEELTRKVEALEKRSKSLLGVLDNLKDLPRQQQELQWHLEAARVQQVAGVIGNVQAAAFGQPGSIFAPDNLLLAGNQLFWMFLDPMLRRFGVIRTSGPSVVSWLAPVGSVVTGQLVLANRQHVRFISDVTRVTPGGSTEELLRPRIADGYWEEFQRRTDVLATAVVLDRPTRRASAVVRGGVLRVFVVSGGASDAVLTSGVKAPVRVAWMVDTATGNV